MLKVVYLCLLLIPGLVAFYPQSLFPKPEVGQLVPCVPRYLNSRSAQVWLLNQQTVCENVYDYPEAYFRIKNCWLLPSGQCYSDPERIQTLQNLARDKQEAHIRCGGPYPSTRCRLYAFFLTFILEICTCILVLSLLG